MEIHGNSIKSGASLREHAGEVLPEGSNTTHGVSNTTPHGKCKDFCADECLSCYRVQHDAKEHLDAWKTTFLVEECKIAVRENPALDVASIGYKVGRDRWGQRIFLSAEDVVKLRARVDGNYAEVLHDVNGISHEVQIFWDPFVGELGEPGLSIIGMEDVYAKGSFLRRAADATAALRDVLGKLAWGDEYWSPAGKVGTYRAGSCPPLEIRKVIISGQPPGSVTFSHCLVGEDSEQGYQEVVAQEL